MPLTTLVSYGIKDADGTSRRLPWFAPASATEAQLQAGVNLLAPALDAVIDGFIADIQFTKALTVPGGLKTEANPNSEAEKGALLNFSVANTIYSFSTFVPAWLPAQFSGNTPNTVPASLGAAFVAAYLAGDGANWGATNEQGADLIAFLKGKKRFRR